MGDTRERYQQLVEESPDGVVVADRGHVAVLNRAAAQLAGATQDTTVGRPILEIFHPDCHLRLSEYLDTLRARPTHRRIDVRLSKTDGTAVDVELSAAPDPFEDGVVYLFLRDVTDRVRAETALRESEERLSLAVAGAQEGVWDWNLETNAVVYSSRWKQMLGYSDEEIEPHVSAWERLVHPDDRRRADAASESVARGDGTYEAEFRLRHKNGHYVHVLSRGYPIRREPGGPVLRIVGTHLDLTERKRAEAQIRESEERLTLAFAGAQEGVWDWNLETGAVVYSSRWKEMLGYTDAEVQPHISAWEQLLHPDDLPRARAVEEAVAQGVDKYEGEFRLRHKAGHYVHVLSRGFPVRREPGGPVVRIVGTHFDLTERKRTEEMLRRHQEELEVRVRERTAELGEANESLRAEMIERERAERARTELLGRLVFAQEDERRRIAREMHDQFGEQLTALSRGIELLKEACAGREDIRAQVLALEAVAGQLDRDVDHLVWELRPTALDDLGLRAALANYVQDWSRRVNISAELHSSGLLDDRLASEAETTLYRIAQEALTNVAKHSRARNVDVILERRGDQVILVVEDDGVGFDPGQAGTGVHGFGLLGMQERAALVGAALEIESAAGKGTTILLRMSAGSPATMTAHHV